MCNKIIALLLSLNTFTDCIFNCNAFQLTFPLADQSKLLQNAAQRGLSTHISKDFPLPNDVNLIPYVDCLARSTGLPRPRPGQLIRQLESFTRKRFIIEMLKCIGNRQPETAAIRMLNRKDHRLLNFFSSTRYVIWQWLRQLERQENKMIKSGSKKLGHLYDSLATASSPLVARVNLNSDIHKIEPIIDAASIAAIQADPLCLGCLFDDNLTDLAELDGVGGVVIGAVEDVGRGFIRLTGGLRRFQGDLKRFVNTGTNLLIG